MAPAADVAATEIFPGRHSGLVSGTSTTLDEAFHLSMPGIAEPRTGISSEPQVGDRAVLGSAFVSCLIILFFPEFLHVKALLSARATGVASSKKLTAGTWSGSSKPQLLGAPVQPVDKGASFGIASARAPVSSTITGRAVSVVRRKTGVGERIGLES